MRFGPEKRAAVGRNRPEKQHLCTTVLLLPSHLAPSSSIASLHDWHYSISPRRLVENRGGVRDKPQSHYANFARMKFIPACE